MVEETWLNDGDVVVTNRAVNHWVNYISWIENNYPEIHKRCINEIVDLKEIMELK